MILRIRDDDILVKSSSWDNPFERFKQIHEWIADMNGQVVHAVGILVNEIQEFPQCIEYVKEQTRNGTMDPQIHGLQHIEYSRLGFPKDHRLPNRGAVNHALFSQDEIREHMEQVSEHLRVSKEWIADTMGRVPTIWYTPWGADNQYLRAVAGAHHLRLEGVVKPNFLHRVMGEVREGRMSMQDAMQRELFIHWWDHGSRVLRMCLAVKYGSFAAAEKAQPDAFRG